MPNTIHPTARRVNFIQDRTFLDALDRYADKQGVTTSFLIRKALYAQYAPGQVDPVTERERAPRAVRRRLASNSPRPRKGQSTSPTQPPPTDSLGGPEHFPHRELPAHLEVHVSFTANTATPALKLVRQPAQGPAPKSYLTCAEVGKLLKIAPRTLRKLMARESDPIPHFRPPGGRPRFEEAAVRKWAEGGATLAARRARKNLASPAIATPLVRIFGWGHRIPVKGE